MKAKRIDIATTTSIEDVLDVTQMNWMAESQDMITVAGVPVNSHKALVRNDNNAVIGVVGNRYQPVQNNEAFAFMDILVQQNKASYESLYVVGGGSKVIIQAKINNEFEVKEHDVISSYITMINSFDGSTPFKIYFTPIRLWCLNQLVCSFRKAISSITIRHTENRMEKIDLALQVLGKADNYFEYFQQRAKKFTEIMVDKKMVEEFLNSVIGPEKSTRSTNNRSEVLEAFRKGKGNNGETLWDLYNGVTEWVDHNRGNDDEKRMASSLVGSGFNMKTQAWESAMNYIK